MEWFTTGEMIDSLKVGEVANSDKGVQAERNQFGAIVVIKDGREDGLFLSNPTFIGAKWRILPKYVTFEEAFGAMKGGKRIICEYNGRKYEYYMDGLDVWHTVLESGVVVKQWHELWDQITKGKWAIKE